MILALNQETNLNLDVEYYYSLRFNLGNAESKDVDLLITALEKENHKIEIVKKDVTFDKKTGIVDDRVELKIFLTDNIKENPSKYLEISKEIIESTLENFRVHYIKRDKLQKTLNVVANVKIDPKNIFKENSNELFVSLMLFGDCFHANGGKIQDAISYEWKHLIFLNPNKKYDDLKDLRSRLLNKRFPNEAPKTEFIESFDKEIVVPIKIYSFLNFIMFDSQDLIQKEKFKIYDLRASRGYYGFERNKSKAFVGYEEITPTKIDSFSLVSINTYLMNRLALAWLKKAFVDKANERFNNELNLVDLYFKGEKLPALESKTLEKKTSKKSDKKTKKNMEKKNNDKKMYHTPFKDL